VCIKEIILKQKFDCACIKFLSFRKRGREDYQCNIFYIYIIEKYISSIRKLFFSVFLGKLFFRKMIFLRENYCKLFLSTFFKYFVAYKVEYFYVLGVFFDLYKVFSSEIYIIEKYISSRKLFSSVFLEKLFFEVLFLF